MNFKDLDKSIDTGLKAQKNYQFVVICHLTKQRGLKDEKHNICEVLQAANKGDKKDASHYLNCPVWNVLMKKGIINYDKESMTVSLNIELTNDQRVKVSEKCQGQFGL